MDVNLIIDGNYVLYRCVHSAVATKTLYGDLALALKVALKRMMRRYDFNKIYFCSDKKGGSWRKDIYPEYKGKRKKAQDVDWEFVFNTYDAFKAEIATMPLVQVIEEIKIEGDDWIRHLVRESNKQNISTLIISSDGDLHQLLDYRLDPLWINIQWRESNRDDKLFLPSGYELFLHTMRQKCGTDFFAPTGYENFLSLFTNLTQNVTMQVVDIEQMLFKKIVQGDDGDNILSVLIKPTKEGKPRGIGDSGVANIWRSYKEAYGEEIDFFTDAWIDNVIPLVAAEKKMVLDDKLTHAVRRNLLFNRRLIHLHERYMPAHVKSVLDRLETPMLTRKLIY